MHFQANEDAILGNNFAIHTLRHNPGMAADIELVKTFFLALQQEICAALEALDGTARFSLERLPQPGGGFGQPRVLQEGPAIEKAAVQFTHSVGASLPPAASERNPHLAGAPFQAAAISVIVHPRNPFAPTTHMNLRFFRVDADPPAWHFGGGFDLTPYYGFIEDCVHWHRTAAAAAGIHYPEMKAACDAYFHLGHRGESRGIGGLFFDDWRARGFTASLELVKAIGEAFLPAYRPIFERRQGLPYGEAEREWQLHRRGRYAEFNLAIDRGTRYGLQSGRRIESVLASLPPLVRWSYGQAPPTGTREAELLSFYLQPKDWLGLSQPPKATPPPAGPPPTRRP